MKITMICSIFLFASVLKANSQVVVKPESAGVHRPFPYDAVLRTLSGTTTDLSGYRGKKLLIVNVASECGYTYQYEGLQKLYAQFGDRLVVLGFPSNQFGAQEPGSNEDIAAFCENKYTITFPMFEKGNVRGPDKSEIYRWLTDKNLNGWNEDEPSWNFCKYLVGEDGKLEAWFGSRVKPDDPALLDRIR